MFSHYFRSALRHHARHKTTTVINVLCLAFGLTCFAIGYGMVKHIVSGDLFHEKSARTFIVTQRSEFIDAANAIGTLPLAGSGFAPHLKADYPALELVARATRGVETAISADTAKYFALVAYADPQFLGIFDLDFIYGDRRSALRNPHSAVISKELAKRLFGRTNVLGAAILLNNRETVHVTGVLDIPRQPSHIAFDGPMAALEFSLLVSMDVRESMQARDPASSTPYKRFFSDLTFTYAVLPLDGSLQAEQLRNELGRFAGRHVPQEAGHAILGLRPVAEINSILTDFTVQSDKTGVPGSTLVLALSALVLLVSCLSYANLASAQASTRLKETALRRATGATYLQIVMQALIEALLLVLVAACVALLLLPVALATLRSKMGLDLLPVLTVSSSFWIGMAVTLLCAALLASVYPAFISARIQPAQALHSGRQPLTKRRALRFLVAFQFFTASFLLIITSVLNSQNEHALSLSPGPADDAIIVIGNQLADAGIDRELLQNELRRQANIRAVSAIDVTPGTPFGGSAIVLERAEPNSRHWTLSAPVVDYDFFDVAGIALLAGRGFERNRGDESAPTAVQGNVVIDRDMAAQYGWTVPADAVGKSIYIASSAAKGAVGLPRTVIGVVENHSLYLMKIGTPATLYSLDPARVAVSLVRVGKANVAGALRSIDAVWNDVAPNVPLKRRFLADYVGDTHRQIKASTVVWRFLAVFSMIIAAMGLVGIATHAINQRTFEIGVRKSLGASTSQVLTLLLIDFSRPVVIAALLSWPFAFIVAKALGSLYSHPAPLTIAPFAASFIVGLAIAWAAVLKQAVSAARLHPAKVLRYE